jgi:TatD DNase family protein
LAAFRKHFTLAKKFKLPMYFHFREAKVDFIRIITENRSKFSTGVVHSYKGGLKEMKELINMGIYIGVNSCSLKT